MVQSYDAGSLPFEGNLSRFSQGALTYGTPSAGDSATFFEERTVQSLIDKVKAEVDVPNFPQFRDMNEMFLSMLSGVERGKEGFRDNGLGLKREPLPEIEAIRKNIGKISSETREKLQVKICVTGPYTLSSLFQYKTADTIRKLGGVLARIVEKNIFAEKHGEVTLVSLDEPAFGLLNDPSVDYGTFGRENLLASWERILNNVKVKKAKTCVHLHSTADPLFWEIKSLDIIESHVDDPLYKSKSTKRQLEERDKFLKAAVCITNFDRLIRLKITRNSVIQKSDGSNIGEKTAFIWKRILNNEVQAYEFLESRNTLKKRLDKIINFFGLERVLYAGPECGMSGFPTYKSAITCLNHVSKVAQTCENT